MNPWHYLAMASACAVTDRDDHRNHRLGAIGIRGDGVLVRARNSSSLDRRCPPCHAEAKLTKKLDGGATVYVARVGWNGKLSLACPCRDCLRVMRSRGVRKIYYTIDNDTFGRIVLAN